MSPTSQAILSSWSLDSKMALGVVAVLSAVFARLVGSASNLARTISEVAVVGVRRRTGGPLAGHRLAVGFFFRPAPFGAYGSTPAAAVSRAAAASAGHAIAAVAARPAQEIRSRRSWPFPGLAGAAPGCAAAHASDELLDYHGDNPLCLARAAGVRLGTSLARLAQGRARLFPGSVRSSFGGPWFALSPAGRSGRYGRCPSTCSQRIC